jgi:hypothetical protein
MSDFSGYLPELSGNGHVPPDYQAAYVSGSFARGWANAGSDIDICFVVSEVSSVRADAAVAVRLVPDTVPVVQTTLVGRRCEIKYWLDGQVDQMLEKVTWDAAEGATLAFTRLLPQETAFLSRLRHGVALAGADWVQKRSAEIDASAFRSIFAERSLFLSYGQVEDAVGQLASDDLESAVLSAKAAFISVVDAVLAEHGECWDTAKWRARQLKAAAPAQLTFDEYWAVETLRDFDAEDPRRWVEDVLMRCRRISGQVET